MKKLGNSWIKNESVIISQETWDNFFKGMQKMKCYNGLCPDHAKFDVCLRGATDICKDAQLLCSEIPASQVQNAGEATQVSGGLGLNAEEPAPIPSDLPAVWDLVIGDMRARDQLGEARYATRLQPFNGRDVLVDAYQEALDLAVYLRQAIYERDQPQAGKEKK